MTKCWRFDLWKSYSRYLDGELAARTVERVERHLLDCNDCRARVARLRDGQRLAMQLPRQQPPQDGWETLAAALEVSSEVAPYASPKALPAASRPLQRAGWQAVLTSPYFAIAVSGIALLTLSLALLWEKQQPSASERTRIINGVAYLDGAFDVRNFRPVSIAEIDKNTAPHVVAEGYVKEVRMDDKDGDYKFKLVEDVRQTEPFIICEIIMPIKVAPPAVGSRVRVYGVSRYDAKEGRQWHEVHPVLNIETIQ